MNRNQKEDIVADLRDRFARASVALVATNKGLSVGEATELRRSIRAVGGEMRVAKHTLTRLALTDSTFTRLDRFLAGPRGLVFGFDDPAAVAKVLVDFADHHEKIVIEGGALEGEIFETDGVEKLAKMPDLPTLRGRIVRQAMGPGARLAGQVSGPATRIAGAIAALVKKLEADGEGA